MADNVAKFSFLNSALTWAATLVVYPLNKINVRLQVDSSQKATAINAIKDLFSKEGIRGAYRGVSVTPFGMLPTFLITYLYERLNLVWRDSQTLKESSLRKFAPMINVFLAGIPTLMLSTPTSMLMTLIHSNGLTAKQAVNVLKAKQMKAYLDIYRSSILSMSIFFCIRQQLIENEEKMLRNRFSLSESQSVFATAVASSILANLIYQPLDTLQSRLVVGNKNNLLSVFASIRSQGSLKTLFRGFTTKMTTTGIFNCVYLPVYSKLKSEFSLRVY